MSASLTTWLIQNVKHNEGKFIEALKEQQRAQGQKPFTQAEAKKIYKKIEEGGEASGEGAFNRVHLMNVNGKKIAVRLAMDSNFVDVNSDELMFDWYDKEEVDHVTERRFDVDEDGKLLDAEEVDRKRIALLRTDKAIWMATSNAMITPELFFYGYVLKDNEVKLCIINAAEPNDEEKMEKEHEVVATMQDESAAAGGVSDGEWITMDLYGFFEIIANKTLFPDDLDNCYEQIGENLKNLFTKMVKRKILCFDIKPGNTLIYFMISPSKIIYSNSIILKLIDMDADACRFYRLPIPEKKLVGDAGLRKNDDPAGLAVDVYTYIMLMIMGNHFEVYRPYRNFLVEGNIFDPVKKDEELQEEMIIAMMMEGTSALTSHALEEERLQKEYTQVGRKLAQTFNLNLNEWENLTTAEQDEKVATAEAVAEQDVILLRYAGCDEECGVGYFNDLLKKERDAVMKLSSFKDKPNITNRKPYMVYARHYYGHNKRTPRGYRDCVNANQSELWELTTSQMDDIISHYMKTLEQGSVLPDAPSGYYALACIIKMFDKGCGFRPKVIIIKNALMEVGARTGERQLGSEEDFLPPPPGMGGLTRTNGGKKKRKSKKNKKKKKKVKTRRRRNRKHT